METMKEAVTREDVVKKAWRLSGWQVDQRSLDEFLTLVDEYASGALTAETREVSEEDTERRVQEAYDRGVQAGRQEAAALVPAPLRPLPGTPSPGHRFEAENGALWVYLGVPRQRARAKVKRAPAAEPEPIRRCRVCDKALAIDMFRKDTHSRAGRRTECKDCENQQRRERKVLR